MNPVLAALAKSISSVMGSLLKKLNVAVGIIVNPQNELLIAQRPANKPHGLCWEFPGGKVEAEETTYQALCRELKEEIGITVEIALAWRQHFHEYPDYEVTLHTYFVREYRGKPQGCEGQTLKWITANVLGDYEFPEANHFIIEALQDLR